MPEIVYCLCQCEQHAAGHNAVRVAKLDAVEVEHRQTVRRDEAVEREDLVHLHRSDERRAALADNVAD